MSSTSRARRPPHNAGRHQLTEAIGRAVPRFQEGSYAFDDVAAEVLALHRNDLPVMTMLLFDGPASADELCRTLRKQRSIITATLERMQLAGYARLQPEGRSRIELTGHARTWIERIWAPLRQDGYRLLGRIPLRHLAAINDFMQQACVIQETRTAELRAWVASPSSPAKRSHLRGGLSPAALQRVQVFIEANLAEPIHLQDLAARAALSPYHFARAFRTSVGVPPRAFVERRRVERAKQLLATSRRSIAEVAMEAGFGTQSRLTTVFKRHTGFTPATYRRGRIA